MVKLCRSLKPQHLCQLIEHFENNSLTLKLSRDASQQEVPMTVQHCEEESMCEVMWDSEPGNVVKVQIGAKLADQMLAPDIQLFHLTPSIALCLCHVTDPVTC